MLAHPAVEAKTTVVESKSLAKLAKSEWIQKAFDQRNSLRMRWQALLTAADLGQGEISDYEKAFRSSEWFMRIAGLKAVQKISMEKAQEWALQALNDPALVVRSSAVEVVKEIQRKSEKDSSAQNWMARSRIALWSEFHHERNKRNAQNLWIRGQILQTLSQQPLAKEKNQFAELLKNKDPELKAFAQTAIERL